MKWLAALLAGAVFVWTSSGLRSAILPRNPGTDATEFKAAPVTAPTPAAAHGAEATGPHSTAETSAIADGHSLFNDNCEHCHGPDAVEGTEQRNLRHLALRYGNRMDQVFIYTVTHGRPSKGMPNWSGILTRAEFRNILAYLHSIQEH